MCLIIHKPAGKEVPRWIIDSAYRYNSDGFGIMSNGTAAKWADLKPAQIEEELSKLKEHDVAIHFRMATHGKVNKKNAHPFKLKNRAWLMHNGILHKYTPENRHGEKSDTRLFVEQFCNPKISKHGSIPIALLEAEILGNAICIMQSDGVISRYGSRWSEHDGLYFSNEYAWDAPSSSYTMDTILPDRGYRRSKRDYPAYIADDLVQERLPAEDSEYLADSIHWALLHLVDILPFNDCSYIAYEDINLQDELLENEISPNEFLELCQAETMLHLYTWSVANGYIEA